MKFKLRLQCSLIPRLSPHANFHTTSDRKLGIGRAWEQGYLQCAHSTHTPQLVGYLHCLSFVLTMHTYTHTHTQSVDIQVQFTPRLDPEAIHQEALKLATTLTPQTQAPQTQSIEQLQEADQQPSPVSRTIALPLFLPYC